MKFHCPTAAEKRAKQEKPHKVFLFWPRRMNAGDYSCRWLEFVWRYKIFDRSGWDGWYSHSYYKEIKE